MLGEHHTYESQAQFDLGFTLEEGGALENFDFDSFLQNPNDDTSFGINGDFDFNHVPEVGGDL